MVMNFLERLSGLPLKLENQKKARNFNLALENMENT